jgi:hypothetical protein
MSEYMKVNLFKTVKIDQNTDWPFAQDMLTATFLELLQNRPQVGSNKFIWSDFKKAQPDHATQIENSVSNALPFYLKQLKNNIPTNLWDFNETINIPFENFVFRILESDFNNQDLHKIEIKFVTVPILCVKLFESKIFGCLYSEYKNNAVHNPFFIELNSEVGIDSYKPRIK